MQAKKYITHSYSGNPNNTVCDECIKDRHCCGHKPDGRYSCKYGMIPVKESDDHAK